jgi:ABC-2 type transport system permease protein
MRSILVIAQRELKSYFSSPIAYVVLTIVVLLSGVAFYILLSAMVQNASMRAMQSAQTGQLPDPIDMPGQIMQGFFQWTSFILLFTLPVITMALPTGRLCWGSFLRPPLSMSSCCSPR